MVRKVKLDEAVVQAIPLGSLVDSVCDLLKDDPSALLCSREDCERCNAVRESLVVQQ
jgi:hypothetical protein